MTYSTTSRKYAYLWAKYRPALLKLMIASADGPQEYKFSSHEIKSANTAQKVHTFELKLHKSRAVNNIRESVIANDLLWTLQQSGKAAELSGTFTFEFKLDSRFVLHVIRQLQQDESTKEPSAVEISLGLTGDSLEPESLQSEESTEAKADRQPQQTP